MPQGHIWRYTNKLKYLTLWFRFYEATQHSCKLGTTDNDFHNINSDEACSETLKERTSRQSFMLLTRHIEIELPSVAAAKRPSADFSTKANIYRQGWGSCVKC